MMKLDTKHAFLKEDIAGYQDIVTKCHEDLHNKTGKGNDYVGWVEWPNNYDKEEYARLKSVAADIRVKMRCTDGLWYRWFLSGSQSCR